MNNVTEQLIAVVKQNYEAFGVAGVVVTILILIVSVVTSKK